MARGIPLSKMLLNLRAECGLSLDPKANEGVRETHVLHLNRMQDSLWNDFNWPHLKVYRDQPLQAGQSTYAPPDGIVIDRITGIQVRAFNVWADIPYGIDAAERSAFDPDYQYPILSPYTQGQRSWPPRRWAISEDERIEIWPIPDRDGPGIGPDFTTNDAILRVWGIRNLKPLVADDDTCDLDERLIVLWTAAEICTNSGRKDAQYKLNRAKQLQRRMQGNLTPRKRFRLFSDGVGDTARYPGPLAYVPSYVRPGN